MKISKPKSLEDFMLKLMNFQKKMMGYPQDKKEEDKQEEESNDRRDS